LWTSATHQTIVDSITPHHPVAIAVICLCHHRALAITCVCHRRGINPISTVAPAIIPPLLLLPTSRARPPMTVKVTLAM
jgi:hypothetical protein